MRFVNNIHPTSSGCLGQYSGIPLPTYPLSIKCFMISLHTRELSKTSLAFPKIYRPILALERETQALFGMLRNPIFSDVFTFKLGIQCFLTKKTR